MTGRLVIILFTIFITSFPALIEKQYKMIELIEKEKIFWCFLIIALMGLVLSLILSLWFPSVNECNLSCQKCCGGTYCTDTYYSSQDNLCHLVLCEHSMFPFQDKTKCVYKPYR